MYESDHEEMLDASGAWVLGVLADDEAASYATHLSACDECRAEVARLQLAADVLAIAAPQVAAPPSLKSSIMNVARRESELLAAAGASADRPIKPRRRGLASLWPALTGRPLMAGALACVAIALGVGAGLAVRGGSTGATRTTPIVASNGAVGGLVVNDSSAELRVSNMPHPPTGRVYQVWLAHPGQAPTPDAVFTVDKRGVGSVAVRGSLKGVRSVLVTDEPDGGSVVPTRQPVITASPV